ncbi:MAG: hypothetical protein LC660_12195 [Desulfobacteraceae bacterium]|nr:hypothetical protein [Desulfobacteraceae bacterium]
MPELRITEHNGQAYNAIQVYSAMLFPRNSKLEKEYQARARLEVFKSQTNVPGQVCEFKNTDLLTNDIDTVLNSQLSDGHKRILEIATARTKRGIWAGRVVSCILSEYQKSFDFSVKKAIYKTFAAIEETNKTDPSPWWPDSKSDQGKKTWQEYKPVSHLWAATEFIKTSYNQFCIKNEYPPLQTQSILVKDLPSVLSLAKWIYEEIRNASPKFFNPHETLIIPKEYPLTPVNTVFQFLSVS